MKPSIESLCKIIGQIGPIRPIRLVRNLAFLLLASNALAAQTPPTDSWAVADAPYRVGVKINTAPSSPEAGIAINLPDFGFTRADLSDVILIGPDGLAQPLAKIGRRPGGHLVLLAKSMEPNLRYFLYFGGDKARLSPEWAPKVSLLIETKTAPANLHFDSLQDLKTAWAESSEAPGAGFVDQIYQGGNPFGPNTQFLTHYSGYLQIPEAKDITFYTLSSDCSFVVINDQFQFGWPGRHTPRANPDQVSKKEVHCPAGFVKVDYYAAKGDVMPEERLEAAMVLGWQNGKGFETVPSKAWLHAGTTHATPIQSANGQWVPFPRIKVETFVGHAGRWLYELTYDLRAESPSKPAKADQPVQNWSATWEFADGAILSGSSGRRVITGLESQLVKCKLTRDGTLLEELFRIDVPERIQRASINDPGDVRRLIEMMTAESDLKLNPDALRARLAFVCEFGMDADVARFAGKEPEHALDDGLWLSAHLAAIRTHAQADPGQARSELSSLIQTLPPNLRQNNAKELALTEMDLLVFCLRDPNASGRLTQIGFLNPSNDLPRIAKIRIGDLSRLLGNYKEAISQYKGLDEKTDPKTLPVKDIAESIAIRDLLEKGFPQNAKVRLNDWELRHPMAKFDSDFLLLHARTLILLGRWSEALVELESYQKIQPDSPFQIDAQFYLGRVLFDKGSKEEARKLWNSIVKEYPKHPLAQDAKTWAAKP